MAKEVKNKNNRHFFKDFKAELKRVIWPTPKQLVNSTSAVIVIVLITAAIVFGLDFAFKTVNKQGIDRLKNIVSNTSAEENATDNTVNNNVTEESTQENTNDTNTVDEQGQSSNEPVQEQNQIEE